MDALVKPIVILGITIVLISMIMAFIGLDGTFIIDWIGEVIGDFITTIVDFVADVLWPF